MMKPEDIGAAAKDFTPGQSAWSWDWVSRRFELVSVIESLGNGRYLVLPLGAARPITATDLYLTLEDAMHTRRSEDSMMTPEDMEAQRLARDRLTVTMDEIGPVRWTEALLALAEYADTYGLSRRLDAGGFLDLLLTDVREEEA